MIGIKKGLRLGSMVALLGGAGFSQAYAESLSQALKWAYEGNPNLQAQRAQLKHVAENIELAKAGKRPTFDLTMKYLAQNSQSPYTGDRALSDTAQAQLAASMMIWDNGQTDLAIEAARAGLKSAQGKIQSYEQQTLLQTVQSYLSVLEAEQTLKLQKNNAVLLGEQVKSAQVAFDAGASTITELSAAKASAASASAKISLAQANLETARQNYKLYTGHAPGDLEEVSIPKLPSTSKEVEQAALKNSPSITTAIENERQAMHNYRKEERNGSPTISGSLSATRSNNLDLTENDDVANFGVALNVPLYSGGVNSAKARQARDLLESASAMTNAARATVSQTAALAWAEYQNSHATLNAYEKVVEAQALASEGANLEYDLGANTIIDKLTAEQDLLSARTNLLTAKYQRIASAYQVLAVIGKLKIENLSAGTKIIEPLKAPAVAPAKISNGAQAVEKLGARWQKK